MSNEDMGIYTPDAAQEIFVNFIEEVEQEQYFQTLLQLTRKAAECARKDTEVREILDSKLSMCVKCYPQIEKSANIFRAVYLDGDRKPTYKEIGKLYYMNKRTVPRHIDKVLNILVVALFGIVGIEWKSTESGENLA